MAQFPRFSVRAQKMLRSLTVLLIFQLAGEVVSRRFALPVPGPVIGLVFFFAALAIYGEIPRTLRESTIKLFEHLPLFYVPAGVGIMVHLSGLSAEFLPIAVAIVVSTVLAIIATALTMQWLIKFVEPDGGSDPGDSP